MSSPYVRRPHEGRRWRRLAAVVKREQRQPCWLCLQPIDYSIADPNHPDAFSVDHVLAAAARPDLAMDYGNLAATHRACNLHKGSRQASPGLGDPGRQW